MPTFVRTSALFLVVVAAQGCFESHRLGEEAGLHDFDSLEGPLCVLGPPALVTQGDMHTRGLVSVDDAFTLFLSGVRPSPDNEIGAMLARVDARGRVEIPEDFVDPDRTWNNIVAGMVWTGSEYVVAVGDSNIPAFDDTWNVARVSPELDTLAIERDLEGVPCAGPSLVRAGDDFVQLLCGWNGGDVEAFVFRLDANGVVDGRSFVVAEGFFENATALWDGTGIAVVSDGQALVFQRFALDGTPLSPALAFGGEGAAQPSIAWNGASFGIVYADRGEDGHGGLVRYARISPGGVLLDESTLIEGELATWRLGSIVSVGDGFVVAWGETKEALGAPARLEVLPIDASGEPVGERLLLADVGPNPDAWGVFAPVFAASRRGLGIAFTEVGYARDRVWFALLGPAEACPGRSEAAGDAR